MPFTTKNTSLVSSRPNASECDRVVVFVVRMTATIRAQIMDATIPMILNFFIFYLHSDSHHSETAETVIECVLWLDGFISICDYSLGIDILAKGKIH